MACIRKATVFCVLFLALYVFIQVKANECTFDSQCLFGYCCERKSPEDNICRSNCLDESCNFSSDCAPGECCDTDDKCKSDCNVLEGLAGWIVAVIVISIIVVVVIPIGVVVFCCCCAAGAAASARRPAHGGVVVTQPVTTGNTTVIASQQQQQVYPAQQGQPMYPQNPQPYAGQPPPYQPPYQPQGTMYPPPANGPPMAMTTQQTGVKQ